MTQVNNDFSPEIKVGDSESIFRAESIEIVPSSTDFLENAYKSGENVRRGNFLRSLTPPHLSKF